MDIACLKLHILNVMLEQTESDYEVRKRNLPKPFKLYNPKYDYYYYKPRMFQFKLSYSYLIFNSNFVK